MKKLIIFSFVALYLVALMPISMAKAQTRPASLNFNPGNGSTVQLDSNDRFTVDINVDTGGEQISGVDMTILYDPSEVTYVSGTVISTFLTGTVISFPSSNTTGILQAGALVSITSPMQYVIGTGTIGRLTFTPAATNTTDTATFRFNKIGNETDDNTNVASPDYLNFDILGTAPSATLTFLAYTDGPTADLPTITSFNPHEGLHDADVIMVINGTYFGSAEGNAYIGTRSATVSSWSASQIYIIVPQNPDVTDNNSGPHQVKVTRTDGEDAIADGYIYLSHSSPLPNNNYPNITNIAPRSGEEGSDTLVDVWGNNFGSSAGTFSMGSLASRVISWADDHIVVTAYGSRISVSTDTWYPVTVTRTDGLSDTYHGFMVTTGIGFIPLLSGLFVLNGGAAILVKRKWFS